MSRSLRTLLLLVCSIYGLNANAGDTADSESVQAPKDPPVQQKLTLVARSDAVATAAEVASIRFLSEQDQTQCSVVCPLPGSGD